MKVKIIAEPTDGDFDVGDVYQVARVQNELLVWVFDNNEEMQPVYSYEFTWV